MVSVCLGFHPSDIRYWVVVSLLLLLEPLLDCLSFLPSVGLVKLLLLLWCLLPDPYSGSRIVFDQVSGLLLARTYVPTDPPPV